MHRRRVTSPRGLQLGELGFDDRLQHRADGENRVLLRPGVECRSHRLPVHRYITCWICSLIFFQVRSSHIREIVPPPASARSSANVRLASSIFSKYAPA